jgi:hypothetical protein
MVPNVNMRRLAHAYEHFAAISLVHFYKNGATAIVALKNMLQ